MASSREEVTGAILNFFETNAMYGPVNRTLVTLVPKVKNPSTIKEYRPIFCYTILYKIFSKMLISRLQEVLDYFIDPSQAAFVPGRILGDNVILSHEIVKGYDRKGISPRCVMKIDMQKAYDSIEWQFLEDVLIGMQIPDRFIRWIMAFVKTVTYSININGVPSPEFKTKKGVRQGTLFLPIFFVAMEYLTRMLKGLKERKGFRFHPRCHK